MNNRFLEGLAIAAILLLITWALATAAKRLVAKHVDKAPLFQRAAASGHSVGASLGSIVSAFIWLCGLTFILLVLTTDHGRTPPIAVQEFFNSVGSFAPKIVGASICFLVGGMIAKIVRDIVATTLSTVNFDKWANLGGAEAVTGNSAISEIISAIVFILLIVPVGIGALNVLGLPSFTGPVTNMLQIILNVFFGAVLIGAGAILARVLKGFVATADGEGAAPALVYWLTIGLFVFIGIKQMNGAVYAVGGDLARAEEMHTKALKLHEELGAKEGMATQYGNLGAIYAKKDDMANTCAYWRKARGLFTELGVLQMVEKVDDALRQAKCPAE
jgi:hypothetical protein